MLFSLKLKLLFYLCCLVELRVSKCMGIWKCAENEHSKVGNVCTHQHTPTLCLVLLWSSLLVMDPPHPGLFSGFLFFFVSVLLCIVNAYTCPFSSWRVAAQGERDIALKKQTSAMLYVSVMQTLQRIDDIYFFFLRNLKQARNITERNRSLWWFCNTF